LSLTFFQGIDFRNLQIVIQYGVTRDLCSLIQRGGRCGRDPSKEALFLIMYEHWVMSMPIPDEIADDPDATDPDRPLMAWPKQREPTKKERTGLATYQLIQRGQCIRSEFSDYANDLTFDGE
jgi:superfamily II DNA helicase RecQ